MLDSDLGLAFKAYKIKEAAELCRTLDAGAKLKDLQGRTVPTPELGDDPQAHRLPDDDPRGAVGDGLLERNPAR